MNIIQFKKDLKNLSFEEQTDLIKERIEEIITIRERWSVRMYDCEGEIEDLENRLENLDEDSDEYQDLSYELDGWKEECVDLEEKHAVCDELILLHHIRQSNAPAMENAET